MPTNSTNTISPARAVMVLALRLPFHSKATVCSPGGNSTRIRDSGMVSTGGRPSIETGTRLEVSPQRFLTTKSVTVPGVGSNFLTAASTESDGTGAEVQVLLRGLLTWKQ